MALCLLLAVAGERIRSGAGKNSAGYAPQLGQLGKDVIWVPTPQLLADRMLNMAKVTSADYVIDLGSGDGCLVIAAAKRGATALGIEYNPDLVEFARRGAAQEGVGARAAFEKADIFESDFSKATVITMFLLRDINLKLRPKILDLKPGTRIVSNTFDMADWHPDQIATIEEDNLEWHTAYLWVVPAKVNGTWKIGNGRISFTQKFQYIDGTLTMGKATKLTGKLNGDSIRFTAGGVEYTGTVNGDTISGTRSGGGAWKATR